VIGALDSTRISRRPLRTVRRAISAQAPASSARHSGSL
jgi:hypothetical protein